MLFSFAHFTFALALASPILGAVIPIATATTSSTANTTATAGPYHSKGPTGNLFKNSVHEKVYLSEAPAGSPTTEGNLSNTSIRKLLLTHIRAPIW